MIDLGLLKEREKIAFVIRGLAKSLFSYSGGGDKLPIRSKMKRKIFNRLDFSFYIDELKRVIASNRNDVFKKSTIVE